MRLIGTGMGPGDPELVTLKAIRALQAAGRVFVPVLEDSSATPESSGPSGGAGTGGPSGSARIGGFSGGAGSGGSSGGPEIGRAEATVRVHAGHDRIERLVFALNERHDAARRERYWDAAGERVAEWLAAEGGTAVFATIGDPNVYSTFSYLAATVRALLPEVVIETIPGITAMQALSAAAGIPLAEGTEPLVLLPLARSASGLAAALDYAAEGTVVAYKGGRHLSDVVGQLADAGRLDGAVLGSHLGLPDERVAAVSEVDKAPYLSAVLIPARRTHRGGSL